MNTLFSTYKAGIYTLRVSVSPSSKRWLKCADSPVAFDDIHKVVGSAVGLANGNIGVGKFVWVAQAHELRRRNKARIAYIH